MLRRPRSSPAITAEQPPLILHGLVIDLQARSISVDGEAVELTRTEFDLLSTLMARPNAALTRRQLIEAVWGPGWIGDEHVVDVHIGHLRTKLNDEAAAPRFIRTVRAVGYGMVMPT